MELDHGGLGDEFAVEILDIDHHAAVLRRVLMRVFVLVASGEDRAGQRQGDGSSQPSF
jgi:hypothetical protein